jgi:hypothetical protein
MTPTRFQIAKHLTAAIVAVMMAGLLLLGFDGLLVAMRKLAKVVGTAPAPVPAAAPVPTTVETPGVVQTFIVPAAKEAPPDDDAARRSKER